MIHFPPDYQGWLASLQSRLEQPPTTTRYAFFIGSNLVGSIEKNVAHVLEQTDLIEHQQGTYSISAKHANQQLEAIAECLKNNHFSGQWRNELLSVMPSHDHYMSRAQINNDEASNTAQYPTQKFTGIELARIERAAARPLGLTTISVHLIGTTPSGDHWLQRRSADKSIDPNMLDTLVGGLVSAGETTSDALTRETQEEAGLDLGTLMHTGMGGGCWINRPIDQRIHGYMVEYSCWQEYQIPDHLAPVNQDGEVSEFIKLSTDEVIEHMLSGQITPKASFIFAEFFARKYATIKN